MPPKKGKSKRTRSEDKSNAQEAISNEEDIALKQYMCAIEKMVSAVANRTAGPLDIFTAPLCFPKSDEAAMQFSAMSRQSQTVPTPVCRTGGVLWFPKRNEALAASNWMSAADPRPIVSLDTERGDGSKLFTVLPLTTRRPGDDEGEVAGNFPDEKTPIEYNFSDLPFDLVSTLPETRRNLYIVVPPHSPVHPFFDIDCSYPTGIAPSTVAVLLPHRECKSQSEGNTEAIDQAEKFFIFATETLYESLCTVLTSLEELFQTNVAEVAVFDSSNPATGKASFHIHCRMANDLAFASIEEHKKFIVKAKQRLLDETIQKSSGGLPSMMNWAAIDTSVYNRWRHFRLPWCNKRNQNGTSGATLTPHLLHWLNPSESLKRMGIDQYDKDFGNHVEQLYQFLTKHAPCNTGVAADSAPEVEAASPSQPRKRGSTWCMNLVADELKGTESPKLQSIVAATRLALITAPGSVGVSFGESAPKKYASPLSSELPVMLPQKVGVRTPVPAERRKVLLEIFQALSPTYHPNTCPDDSNAVTQLTFCEYEDNTQIRAYYCGQKKSKYCLNLKRQHKSTFGQLYITYKSIKYRCYSNDCCDQCLDIPWNSLDKALGGEGAGTRSRERLFPPLSNAELRRRYPHLASNWPSEIEERASSMDGGEEEIFDPDIKIE